MIRLSRVPLPLVTLVALVLSACDGDAGLVARAYDQTWTVDEASTLVAAHPDIPADREAIRALANLWIDYTVLATAAAEDSTLAQVDVTPLVNELAAQQLIVTLRDSVITVEPIGNAELLARYRREAPGSAVRARQILVTWPDDATEAQKDSVRRSIEDLRSRIVDGGEDFATLAGAYSRDPGSAGRGGEMGTVRRGQLVAPLDTALFSLEPGEVSQPVESPYGLHLVQVEERLTPPVEQFRLDLMNHRAAVAESVYVAGLEAQVSPQAVDGAAARVRELAQNFRTSLTPEEASRPLLRYEGGEVTEGQVLWYLQSQPPATRTQVAASNDQSIPDRILRAVADRQLLVLAAQRRGWSVQPEAMDRVAQTARRNLSDAARQLGLFPIVVAPGQQPAAAVHEAVSRLLAGMLSGEKREVTPLGVMSYILRRQYPGRVVEAGLDEVAARVGETRRGVGSPGGGTEPGG
jgi:hypothetical protein